MSQAKATRCGPCNKPVKDNDSTAIGCEKCSAWFHGQCVGLSPDDVATMGEIRGCFWLCSGCLEGNIFTSQAKFELIIQNTKSIKETVENVDPTKTTLSNVPVNSRINNSHRANTCENEIIIDGVCEDNGQFTSNIEAEEAKVAEIFDHIGEENLSICQMYRLGKANRQQGRPHTLLVRLSFEWNARKCLAKSYKLKNFKEKIFISKSLNQEEQILKCNSFKKRYDMINNEKVPRVELKIRGLTLE